MHAKDTHDPILNAPAGREWAKAKFEALEDAIREAKAIGVEARQIATKPHVCVLKEDLTDMREEHKVMSEEIGQWRFFKKLFFVTLGIVLSALIGAIVKFYDLTNTTDKTAYTMQQSIDQLNYKQTLIDNNLRELPKIVKETMREGFAQGKQP